jgi:hypothetical protein
VCQFQIRGDAYRPLLFLSGRLKGRQLLLHLCMFHPYPALTNSVNLTKWVFSKSVGCLVVSNVVADLLFISDACIDRGDDPSFATCMYMGLSSCNVDLTLLFRLHADQRNETTFAEENQGWKVEAKVEGHGS